MDNGVWIDGLTDSEEEEAPSSVIPVTGTPDAAGEGDAAGTELKSNSLELTASCALPSRFLACWNLQ